MADTLTFELIESEELPALEEKRGVIENNKLLVRGVQLKGDRLLFPEYGITRAFLEKLIADYYIQLGPFLSVSDLHTLAYELTRAYRARGLAFAEVFVTPQEVVEGEVVLRVLVGALWEVHVQGASRYDTEQLVEPFESQFARPVYVPAIEKRIDQLNRLPGLEVYGVFSVGRQQGETRLNLRVLEETARRTRIRLDNHGVDETGQHRLQLHHQENNLFGMGDTLRLAAMGADQSGTLMGGLNYSQPVGTYQRGALGYSRSQFDVGGRFSVLDLTGELDTFSTRWTREATSAGALRWQASFAYKRARVNSDAFPQLLDEEDDYFMLDTGFDRLLQSNTRHLVHHVQLKPAIGHVVETDDRQLEDTFFTLRLGYSLRYQWSEEKGFLTKLVMRGQYSPNLLPSPERASLTGAAAVRGFEPGRFSADSYYRLALEQQLHEFRWEGGWRLTPSVFTDFAHGWQDNTEDSRARFLAAGLALDLSYAQIVEAGLAWGIPINENTQAISLPDNDQSVVHGFMSLLF